MHPSALHTHQHRVGVLADVGSRSDEKPGLAGEQVLPVLPLSLGAVERI
jgi:hypothetical protein